MKHQEQASICAAIPRCGQHAYDSDGAHVCALLTMSVGKQLFVQSEQPRKVIGLCSDVE